MFLPPTPEANHPQPCRRLFTVNKFRLQRVLRMRKLRTPHSRAVAGQGPELTTRCAVLAHTTLLNTENEERETYSARTEDLNMYEL